MASLNKAFILGNLGQDPELRYTQNDTAVTNLSIATTQRYKDKDGEQQEKTTWHRVVLWARLAEIAEEYLSKGDPVLIEGRIQKKKWEDKDGNERWNTEIVGQNLQLLGSGNGGNNSNSGGSKGKGSAEIDEDFDDLDDDLPF